MDRPQDDPAPNPIFVPRYPASVTDTTRHLDAGINAALYGPDSVFGATEEEIETALLLAADLPFRSTMLYGHEYSADVLKSQIKKMTGG